MRARKSGLLTLLILPLMAACNLVKLSDKVGQAHCKTNQDCDVLNDKGAGFDACEVWQCAQDTKLCEFGPLDADGDGFSPASATAKIGGKLKTFMCESDPAKQDCDDTRKDREPDHEELCDGADNDCDGKIDEDALKVSNQSTIVFSGASQDGVNDLSYAVDLVSGTLGIGMSINRMPNKVPGVAKIANSLPGGNDVLEVKPPALPAPAPNVLVTDGVGIAAVDSQTFAIAFFDRQGSDRMLAGTVDFGAQNATLKAPAKTMIWGLSCEHDEPCLGNAASPDTVLESPNTETPAIAAQGDDVLVAYVRNAGKEDPEKCYAKDASVMGKPVLANWLQRSQDGLEEVTTEALVLGTSGSVNAPALLGIPPIGPQAQPVGWLAAFPDETGTIQIVQVSSDSGALTLGKTLLSLGSSKARYGNVRLALGAGDDAGREFGVTYESDCDAAGRVHAGVFKLIVDKAGTLKASVINVDATVGGATAEKRPAITYSDKHKSWAVAYVDPKGLHARVLDEQGKPVGLGPYMLLKNAASGASATQLLALPTAVVPLKSDTATDWFAGITYAEQGAAKQVVLNAGSLSCPK